MVNARHAFWQALILALIIFALGMLLGFFLEMNRGDKVELNLIRSETLLLDNQLRSRGISDFNVSCNEARISTFAFADRIYEEALQLEKYDSASKFTDTMRVLHRRYDLLRTMLWLDSLELKQTCPREFHTVVYIFEYAPEDINARAQQASISHMLTELKNEYPDEVLLIPIAGNLGLESVDIIKQEYNIQTLPAIIIDEETVITGVPSPTELQDSLFQTTGQMNNSLPANKTSKRK